MISCRASPRTPAPRRTRTRASRSRARRANCSKRSTDPTPDHAGAAPSAAGHRHALIPSTDKENAVEFGRYLVLSPVHVCMKPADLLDAWAVLEPSSRPLAVASTHYGWFIPTREAEEPDRQQIP